MIKYKDFAPRITERGPFGGASEYESFSEVVSTANQWNELPRCKQTGATRLLETNTSNSLGD
ncbi:hypothetical protein HC928_16425 [bacterium]|nr:hypothetical protein [bacterium]